jgi:hypothetical protein
VLILDIRTAIPPALSKIDELAGEVEVVLFNAARIKPSEVLGTSVEEIEEDFKVCGLTTSCC